MFDWLAASFGQQAIDPVKAPLLLVFCPSSFSDVLLTLRFYTSLHGFPMSCPHLYKDYHMCVNYFVHISKYIEYISPYTSPFCLSSAHHFPLVFVGPLELLLFLCYMYLHKIQEPQMRRNTQYLSFRGWFNSLYVIISAVSIFPANNIVLFFVYG